MFAPNSSASLPCILRLPQVEAACGVKKSFIYAAVKAGTFPAPVALGTRARGWLASEIDAWITARAASRQS